ncbi:MAG: FMN-binding protein [Firmicutes bacterium]|nr:FMN-binding protein [Bacillota bacterium]
MKKQAWLILCLIALVAGFALAATNLVTAGPIEQQRILAIEAARKAVFPEATSFEELAIDEDTGLDSLCIATSDTEVLGSILQTTVSGYAGPIQIILGIDPSGSITGLTVGGSKFAETAGLGTRVKEPAFTNQFVGLSEMPTPNGNVDTISGATISSSAVIDGIILCYQQWEALNETALPSAAADPN